jgi:Fe-S-cluster containining protein
MSYREYRELVSYAARPENGTDVEAAAGSPRVEDLGDGSSVAVCRFRDTSARACAVYPVRPLVCRLMGHVEWMPCPVGAVDRAAPTADALALMEAYARLDRRTYAQWTAGESGEEVRECA